MEPESHATQHSRLYEAAESMLQHARMSRPPQQSLNGSRPSNNYPPENDLSQQLNRMPTVPISPYPAFSITHQSAHAEQAHNYNSVEGGLLDSPQDMKTALDQHGQQTFPCHPSPHVPFPSDDEVRQLSGRGVHAHDTAVKQFDVGNYTESSSPVSSRGFVSKEAEMHKPLMRPLGKKSGKKSTAIKEEDEKPPPWSELKTKAGKDRKRLPLACIACRRKKIRCSGEKPACKHCFRSRTPCVYKVTTRKAAPRTDYMAMLDKRLKRMEERVIKIIPGDEVSNVSVIGRAHVRPPGPAQGTKAQNTKKRAADEAFGPEHGDWASLTLSKSSARSHDRDLNKTLTEGSEKLPSKDIQEHLAEVYFDCLYGQTYLLLHKPSFMKRLRYVSASLVKFLH